ncbi:MAG: UDP-N-acetylglucosamine 2-epimerase (non-hydrolyzing) [Planctomycetes bacterium]|nr:UDP-N-acetylglucosamine 2-epimerase (non-hydrolyzing) [Planctomycetota bacterium]
MTRSIAVFMGTRPEAIKMAPVIAQLEAVEDLEPLVINTGQHREMIQQVIDLFGISVDHELQVMRDNQTLAGLSSRLIEKIDTVLADARPDMVLVQGDTTTVLCAALASFYQRIPIGHVEAGLRTGNMRSPFPEEANRRLVSPLADLHFAPTEASRQALLAESIRAESIVVTGNTVVDALFIEIERQEQPEIQEQLRDTLSQQIGPDWLERPSLLVTGHRRENLGDGFEQICAALAELSRRFPEMLIVYPVHLNPNVLKVVHERLGDTENIRLIKPQPYAEFVTLEKNSRLILTDSGGVQEEAPSLGKPVLVMRDTTERPEGVQAGTVKLVGAQSERIVAEATALLTDTAAYQAMSSVENPYGDGRAAERIVQQIVRFLD